MLRVLVKYVYRHCSNINIWRKIFRSKPNTAVAAFQMHWLAIGYALLFTISGYWPFVNKGQKG
jgi:hypothetical protein